MKYSIILGTLLKLTNISSEISIGKWRTKKASKQSVNFIMD